MRPCLATPQAVTRTGKSTATRGTRRMGLPPVD